MDPSPAATNSSLAGEDLARLRINKAEFGRRRGRKGRFFLLVTVVAALLGAGFLYAEGALTPATAVRLANVTTLYPAQTFTELNASGYVVAQRKAALGSKLTSRLIYLAVEEGDRVREGQIVARLENADLAAARNRAKANVEVARAMLARSEAEWREAELAYQRAREMLARKFFSQAEFDAAEARYQSALAVVANQQANLRLSEAMLSEAEVQLDYTNIRAPFDAVVLTKNADVGDIITPLGAAANARASVVTIADMDSYQVEADVAESNIAQVQAGQPCEIQLDALPEVRLRGRVHMIVPTADRSKATVLVKVAFLDEDPRILPEMSAKVAFLDREIRPDEQEPVTAAPAAALVEKDGGILAFVARDGQAVAAPVKVGRRFGDLVEITAGLQAGDRVVLNPQAALQDGAKIRAAEG